MKTLVLLGFILLSAYIVYEQDRAHQLSLDQEEQELLKNLSKENLTPAIKKVMTYQARHPASIEDELGKFSSLQKNLPGDARFNAITLDLMETLSSVVDSEVDFNDPRLSKALKAFNNNPKQAQETMLILLDHAKSTQDDLLVARLLEMTNYIEMNRSEILDLSEELLTTEIIDGRAEFIADNQFKKMKEASRILVEAEKTETEIIASIKTVLTSQTNPILRKEILLQLETRYPERARLLDLEFFPREDSLF